MKKVLFYVLVLFAISLTSCSNYEEESVFNSKLESDPASHNTGEDEEDDPYIDPSEDDNG